MTLADLQRGDSAIVTAVTTHNASLRERCHSRGMVPGAELSLIQKGNPLVFRIDHSRWALSKREALHISVSLLPKPHRKSWFFLKRPSLANS